jgi:hypothetical protein
MARTRGHVTILADYDQEPPEVTPVTTTETGQSVNVYLADGRFTVGLHGDPVNVRRMLADALDGLDAVVATAATLKTAQERCYDRAVS